MDGSALKGRTGTARARDSAVRVFVMGVNQWRSAESVAVCQGPARTLSIFTRRRPWVESGRLLSVTAETGRGESVVQSDPAHRSSDPFNGRAGAHDYRALPGRPEVAVFETPPFTAPHEIVGRVVVELAVSASVPDFDVWVQLYDVAPDGTAWNLSSPGTGLARASYRDGGPERHSVPDGEVVRLRLDRMVTANRFLPGHRLRVVGLDCVLSIVLGESTDGATGIRERGHPGRGGANPPRAGPGVPADPSDGAAESESASVTLRNLTAAS